MPTTRRDEPTRRDDPDTPLHAVPPDPPPPDAAAPRTRTPQALGTDDPGQRRLGEPKPGEPSAAEDPNNPVNQNADPEVRRVRDLEGKLAEKMARLVEKNDRGAYKTGLDTLVARYLENHGRWRSVTHRTSEGAIVADTLVGCECAICDDARAALKLDVDPKE